MGTTAPPRRSSFSPAPPSSLDARTGLAAVASEHVEKDPFLPNKSFYRLAPVSVLWSLVAHLVVLLASPFPRFRVRARTIDDVSPRHRLVVDSSGGNRRPVAVVTGSNTGVGFETAAALAAAGHEVVLACRSADKGRRAAERINASCGAAGGGGGAVFLTPLDLSSIDSVESFCRTFADTYGRCAVLVNNAGVNSTGKTADGMDACFQTNFLGHYLLTRRLLPFLRAARRRYPDDDEREEAGRVVNLSSVTYHFAGCREERPSAPNDTGEHDAAWWRATATPGVSDNTYKESKLAALLLTLELNRRYGDGNDDDNGAPPLVSVAVNPGAVNSDIWRNFPKYMERIHELLYLDPKQGSVTSVVGATTRMPEGAVYLQPYWQPLSNLREKVRRRLERVGLDASFGRRWYAFEPHRFLGPLTEFLGVPVGFAVAEPRLPRDPARTSSALWDACEELLGGPSRFDEQK